MKYLSLLLLAPLSYAAALPNPFAEAEAVSPAGVQLREVAYAGSGCNQGTLSINVDEHGTMCPIRTKDLWAADGPGTNYDDFRRFCQLTFSLVYPQGWSFSVLGARYRGHVSLKEDSTATFRTSYYFSGETDQVVSTVNFKGPTSRAFEEEDVVVWDTWSPCGNTNTMLNVKQEVLVSGTGKLASMSAEGQFGNAVLFKWRHC
ncbi:hypothetical protein AJ79_08289 [Helicocarpus griseus UAMH5409]|uniref:Secreted protein n=1 Tax=Helicocarpus griseus UAMH5409 TaxID=1447875 RepID=A0A2B7WLD8_9EURO|nr:hypothetical protein AJ79_08289 [Helicocarpus griseus UAMH5409]